MHGKLAATITTWPFVASLITLLLNDAWLKGTYPGWVSGKLSDIAGIAIVGLLLLASCPKRPKLIYCLISVLFAWWKSPLSQPLIDTLNLFVPFTIGRTVDYSDLLALMIMPICSTIAKLPANYEIPGRLVRRLIAIPIMVATMLGLMATSVIPTRQDYQIRRTESSSEFNREAIASAVYEVAQTHGLRCENCREPSLHASYRGNGMYLEYQVRGSNMIAFSVDAFPNGFFFGTSGREKADKLRADLKARLSAAHKGLEYIEPLNPPR